ncbi:MAG: hypothetical protein IJ092_02835 [Atopobiaceae bacterium]|nr:hypothetical protein [Atopobiaceae bacterium]
MSFAATNESAEKKELAEPPSLLVDGSPNIFVLSDAGAYFNDHFAFRNELVDLNALLKQSLLMTSATDRVIVGSDGWLFYDGTRDDYQRTNLMSDRALFNAAHNVMIVQRFAESNGCTFALAIAPNKNTLYPDHMPYFLLAGTRQGNFDRFETIAREMGINLVDLKQPLSDASSILYYKMDSHWTNEGARIASEVLFDALGHAASSLEGTATHMIDHLGDVATMLRPLSSKPEADVEYEGAQAFTYLTGETVEDNTIETTSTSDSSHGTLVAYRDSFGNALLPYLASEYKNAYFSKLMPYDMGLVVQKGADSVLMERAERHLSSLATTPPYLYSPRAQDQVQEFETKLDSGGLMTARINGPYLQIGGYVDDGLLEDDSTILLQVSVDGQAVGTYDCFLVSSQLEEVSDVAGAGEPGSDEVVGDGGYRAFLQASQFTEVMDRVRLRLIRLSQGEYVCVMDEALQDVFVDVQ